MGLLSIFKRAEVPPNASEPADAVQRARIRARQRLVGAAVLVVIGVIGFPIVFETQPRPIPVDILIEVPRREGAPPIVMPAARLPAAVAASAPPSVAPGAVITESREEAGREVAAASATPAVDAGVKPAPKPIAEPPTAAVVEPAPKPAAADADGSRARAILEAKPVTAATLATATSEAGRFIVQVGAFADAGAARETRLKVERLGLKTYTQVAATSSGNRIRVRVGPFGTRDEADRAMAKAKSAGLSAVVLTL